MTSVPVRMYVAAALNVATEVDSQHGGELPRCGYSGYYAQRWLTEQSVGESQRKCERYLSYV